MDTMTTETVPVEEAAPATEAPSESGEGQAEATDTESVESLKAKLAATEEEADRAKRFIVNFVAGKGEGERREMPPDPLASIPADAVIEEFKENPLGLLDKHFATRMAPIVADNLEARAKDNRTAAIRQLGAETWGEYGEEIDRFMGGLSLHTRANPGSYEEALNFVRAKNIDKEIDKRVKSRLAELDAEKKGLVEGSGTRAGSVSGAGAPRMTEAEKQIAKGFGMSEKEWMKYKTPRERSNG
jgi:hypothetical protein